MKSAKSGFSWLDNVLQDAFPPTQAQRIRLYQQQPIPCKDDKTITCWHCNSTVCQDALEGNKLETRYRCPVCKTTLYEVKRHSGRPGKIRIADSE